MKSSLATALALVIGLLASVSCVPKPKPQWLMPTPQIYQKGGVDPFGGLAQKQKGTRLPVYYATNRKPAGTYYGSSLSPRLRFGVADVAIGHDSEDWNSLAKASRNAERSAPMPLRLLRFDEFHPLNPDTHAPEWLKKVGETVRQSRSKDVLVYVHGAKVEFFHSCAFAAEVAHFTGREITPVAFDWPTHPEILSYITRVDINHGIRSAEQLAELVRVLSTQREIRRIHLVSWSAGARVLSRAMVKLGGDKPESLRSRYRIGTAVFAASDVPERDFLERLPAIHGLSDRVLVYLSDGDNALKWSSILLGGGRRLGMEPGSPTEEEISALRNHPRLEVVDTSYGRVERGFDITGHRYWYQHPWVSSDLMVTLRTDANPASRGLKPTAIQGVWCFSPDYGDRIGGIARALTSGKW